MLIRMLGAASLIADAIPWPEIFDGVTLREAATETARVLRHPVLLFQVARAMRRAAPFPQLATGPIYPMLRALVEELRRSSHWPAFVKAWGEPDDLEIQTAARVFQDYRDEARARLYRSGIRMAVVAGGAATLTPEPKN